MKKLFFIMLVAVTMTNITVPKAVAMDPVTIAILAPILLPYAETAGKYALKGLMNGAIGMIDVFAALFDFFRLPLGMFQVSFGLPFGLLGDGLYNLGTGAVAPFKMMLYTLLLPVKFFGFG